MKAIALISGGLDSLLAARLIQEQGIEIIPLHFVIPFCFGKSIETKASSPLQELVLNNLKCKLVDIPLIEDFLEMIKDPDHGFGSQMNPCIDCKILMFSKARMLMQEYGASFIVSGEILGQRPMSQHRAALSIIEKESNLLGLLVRPLCGQLLPKGIAVERGWIDPEKLLRMNGRSRRPQLELAKKFNFVNTPNAAGGCLLTDPAFSKRIKDLRDSSDVSFGSVELLKIGRHFRLDEQCKLVVGRDEKENNVLEKKVGPDDYIFIPDEKGIGPCGLGKGIFNQEIMQFAASIVAFYCDTVSSIRYKKGSEESWSTLQFEPVTEAEIIRVRI